MAAGDAWSPRTTDDEHAEAQIARQLPRDIRALNRRLDHHNADAVSTASSLNFLQGEMSRMSDMMASMNANFAMTTRPTADAPHANWTHSLMGPARQRPRVGKG